MVNRTQAALIDRLCASALRPEDAALTDGQLLDRFVVTRDERAFEWLVRRHGPMVLGVCRRILRHEADAEDAFQATFLVLASKARSIRPRTMVGNWLHGVAQNTALKANVMRLRRRRKEREAGETRKHGSPAAASEELFARLDRELAALPVRYRAVLVLCELEGLTIEEVARHLGRPPGTVATHLRRGRHLLARRLGRLGFCLSAAGLAELVGQAAVPGRLIMSTVQAAVADSATATALVVPTTVVALKERVIKAMFLKKLQSLTAALLVLGVAASAGGLLAHRALRADPGDPPVKAKPAEGKEKPRSDHELILGTWIPVSGESGGKEIPKEQLATKLVITKDKFTLHRAGGETEEYGYSIDPEKKPKEIDVTLGDKTYPGIYELKGTTLKHLWGSVERPRPADFDSTTATIVTYEKKKEE
jgi:RNA polymerase sigma factor (sigma-70 family)